MEQRRAYLWTRIMIMEGRCEVSLRDRSTPARVRDSGIDETHSISLDQPSSAQGRPTAQVLLIKPKLD
ncbi:unnamed protein product [Arctia plantaginis]|uniref:Uncharacterized protein n=1 Tax=Arctia plantaginis TaxID=874455 RepID=A0A8S1B525_ARCPL|nr:unnamed protein product [Arctia plantaginis]